MAFPIGRIQEFDAETESITAYLERVQLFAMANAVDDDKKVAVLLSVIGSKTYSLLRNLLEPEKPSSKTYDELVGTLKRHYEPKPVVIAERFSFYRRMQALDESFATYIAELKSLTRNCSFGDHLEEALQDQLVCGMRSISVQKILLREADLTFKKAVEMAMSAEAADRHAKQLLRPTSSPGVNKIVANQQAAYPKGSFKGGARQPKPRKSINQLGKRTRSIAKYSISSKMDGPAVVPRALMISLLTVGKQMSSQWREMAYYGEHEWWYQKSIEKRYFVSFILDTVECPA